MLLSGCVTPQIFLPIKSDRGTAVHEAVTVRSQDSQLQDSQLPAQWSGTAETSAVTQSDVQPAASSTRIDQNQIRPVTGHAFAQPKARLGRPVPLPVSTSSPTTVPSAGHAEHFDPARQSSFPNQAPVAELTPWNKGRAASQPGLSADAANSEPLKSDPVVPDSEATIFAQSAAATLPENNSENPEGPNSAAVGNGPLTAIDQPEVAAEPTMLDRLRGLYNPRIDENTDKLRKQIRRWPDPFGLLKDREQSTLPVEENNVPPDTAQAGSQSADSSLPSQPEAEAGSVRNSHIQLAIQELEAELAGWPQKMSGDADRAVEWRQKQTDLRLLYLIAGKSAESVRVIESLPEEEQEFWQSLMMSMNSYREHPEDVDRTEQLTESLRHLRTASKKLQPLSRLTVQRTMLCDRIDGFGNVVAFPTSVFEPGQRVLVYTELQNFQSELTEDGKYRSEFAARIEFMREGDDEVLGKIQVLQIEDLCDVERTDYFQSFELTLPALEGKYRMRILLRDYLSQQVAESSLEFSVRSRSGGP